MFFRWLSLFGLPNVSSGWRWKLRVLLDLLDIILKLIGLLRVINVVLIHRRLGHFLDHLLCPISRRRTRGFILRRHIV
jgi:hypothetical protein